MNKSPEVQPTVSGNELIVTGEVGLMQNDGESYLSKLARMEQGVKIFARYSESIEACRRIAIRRTRPSDWIISKDREGIAFGMLTASGVNLVAELYRVRIFNVRPVINGVFQPEISKRFPDVPESPKVYRGWCDAMSDTNGAVVENLECTRSDDEDFTGRQVSEDGKISRTTTGKALESDIRCAVQTLMRSKATRILCGMSRVTIEELDQAWEGTYKNSSQCRRGHGFGTSSDRRASGVSEVSGDQKAQLQQDLTRAAGGDKEIEKALLKRVTAYPAKQGSYPAFEGFVSVDRMTKSEAITRALGKLHDTPEWKAASATREEGDEVQKGLNI